MHESILLVDDDDFARGFARTVLERSGFAVHEADDVASALRAADAYPPSAVVTDWNLPDGDGGVLTRKLRGRAALLPVILITGDSAGTANSSDGARCDFNVVLQKLFLPSALERAIRSAMAR